MEGVPAAKPFASCVIVCWRIPFYWPTVGRHSKGVSLGHWLAPPDSNPSSGRGNEAVGAFGGRVALGDWASVEVGSARIVLRTKQLWT
jgi:hypothetical protein